MKQDLTVKIENEILLRFNMALRLNAETAEDALEQMIRSYIANSFSKEASAFGAVSASNVQITSDGQYYGKALSKIKKWAYNRQQINSKIVRAYLQLQEEIGCVTLHNLMMRCSDPEQHPDVYVNSFSTNFAQMKFDGEKSHGKVFVVDNDIVTIWDVVEEEIMKYKSEFTKDLTTLPGYINVNKQQNLRKTDLDGTDFGQKLYLMRCLLCGHEYKANGSDIHLKKCPKCQSGADTGNTKQE